MGSNTDDSEPQGGPNSATRDGTPLATSSILQGINLLIKQQSMNRPHSSRGQYSTYSSTTQKNVAGNMHRSGTVSGVNKNQKKSKKHRHHHRDKESAKREVKESKSCSKSLPVDCSVTSLITSAPQSAEDSTKTASSSSSFANSHSDVALSNGHALFPSYYYSSQTVSDSTKNGKKIELANSELPKVHSETGGLAAFPNNLKSHNMPVLLHPNPFTATMQISLQPKIAEERDVSVSALNASNGVTRPPRVPPGICAQRTVSTISVENLQALFHMTLIDASKYLGMSTTVFKKICRKNNIEKWPYRQIHSLLNKVDSLRSYLADSGPNTSEYVKKTYEDQIRLTLEKIDNIKKSACVKKIHDKGRDSEASSEEIGSELELDNDSLTTNNLRAMEKNDFEQPKSVENESSASSDESSKAKRGWQAMGSDSISTDSDEILSKRKRCKTSYDLKTGWIANCSTCGKVGKYRHPSQGRVFQHSSGTGKYCGYFRENPRRDTNECLAKENDDGVVV